MSSRDLWGGYWEFSACLVQYKQSLKCPDAPSLMRSAFRWDEISVLLCYISMFIVTLHLTQNLLSNLSKSIIHGWFVLKQLKNPVENKISGPHRMYWIRGGMTIRYPEVLCLLNSQALITPGQKSQGGNEKVNGKLTSKSGWVLKRWRSCE